jgi:hypothetical protein
MVEFTLVSFMFTNSSIDRDVWGLTRKSLELSGINKATLNQIDTSLFLISLDNEAPTDKEVPTHHNIPCYILTWKGYFNALTAWQSWQSLVR